MGRFQFKKTPQGAKKSLTCSHRKILILNILKILHVYPHYLAINKFSTDFPQCTLYIHILICIKGSKCLQTAALYIYIIYIVYQKVFVRTAISFYKFAFFKRTANLYAAINNRSLSLDKNSTKLKIVEFCVFICRVQILDKLLNSMLMELVTDLVVKVD